MTENKETSRLLRFYNAYGKHLDIISFALIMVSVLISFAEINFRISYVTIPLWGDISVTWLVVIAIICFHGILTIKLAEREMYAYKILYTERIEAFVLLFSLSVVLSVILFIFIRPYFFPAAITGILPTLLFWVFSSFFFLLVISAILLALNRLIPSYVRAGLCFIITLDSLHALSKQESHERRKCISKYFKWLKVGLHYYNDYIMGKLPNHPQVKEIDSYYDISYLLALTGNPEELKDLESYINEINDSLREKDFRRFLISLQHMKGKKTKKETSIYQLSNLFRTVPLSSRIMTFAKPTATVLIVVITIVASILQIMTFLGM